MNDEKRSEEQPADAGEPTAETREQAPGGEPSGRGRLTRMRSGRMLAGVAAGLGRYFDVDPVIFRIAFGVSIFFGGFGALAYLALALFLPDEDGKAIVGNTRWGLVAAIALIALVVLPAGFLWDGGWGWGHWGALWLLIPLSIAIGAWAILRERGEPVSGLRVLAAVFVAGAAVVGFFALALFGGAVTAFGHGIWIAVLVLAGGLAVLGAAFSRGLRWLIVPALALASGVGVAAAADLDFEGGIGERDHAPLSAEAIPHEGYELAIGDMRIDLRETEWKRDQVVPLRADVGIGAITIAVPEQVCVEAEASTTAGTLRVAGERQEGIDVELSGGEGATATPRLVLESEVQIGQLQVINDDDFDLGDRGHPRIDEGEAAAQRAAQARACAA
jgi:phage shock protein PspC (stress-responsive transcriptional regulator)